MKLVKQLVAVVVLAIGLYMLYMNYGGGLTTPPVLSGLAFTLLGGLHTYKAFACGSCACQSNKM